MLPIILIAVFTNCGQNQKQAYVETKKSMEDQSFNQVNAKKLAEINQNLQQTLQADPAIVKENFVGNNVKSEAITMKSANLATSQKTTFTKSTEPIKTKSKEWVDTNFPTKQKMPESNWEATRVETKTAHKTVSNSIQLSNSKASPKVATQMPLNANSASMPNAYHRVAPNFKSTVKEEVETKFSSNSKVKLSKDKKSALNISKSIQTKSNTKSTFPTDQIASIKNPQSNTPSLSNELKRKNTFKEKKKIVNNSMKVATKMPKANTGLQEIYTFKNQFLEFLNGQKESNQAYSLEQMKFNRASQRISYYSKSEFLGLAEALKANKNKKVAIEVHTLDGKNERQNKRLSNLRAQHIQSMFVTLGVKRSQIDFKGKGSASQEKATNNTVEILLK